jgi:hypothetical protein
MQSSETITELAKALAKAQGAIKPAEKDSINPHFKNRYADLASMWAACREALSSNGLSVLQLPTDTQPGYCTLETVLLHTSGEHIISTASIRLGQDTAQGYGSALTYLRRYALAALVGIVADDDDDGNATQPRPQQQKSSAPKRNGNHRPTATDDDPHAELRQRAAELTGRDVAAIRSVKADVLQRWIDEAGAQSDVADDIPF